MDVGDLGTTAVIAAVLVPFVSLIKRPTWGAKVNFAIGMLAALVAAAAGTVIDNQGTALRDLVPQFATALATAQTVYHLYFASTGLNDRLTNVGA